MPTQLTVLSLALTDGFYVHANSEVHLDLDFEEYADLAARALESLVDDFTRRAAKEGQAPAPPGGEVRRRG